MSSLTRGKLSSGLDQFSLSLSSGTLSLKDAEGNTISTSNPVKIQLRHTDGTLKTYYITEEFTFRDDANATKSDFLNSGSTDGMEFGVTAATAFGNARPLVIGWLHDGTNAYPAFSFDPTVRSSGAASNIGYKEVKASSPSDSNIVVWTTTNITTSHANVMFIPFATCTATMSASEDWTLAVSVTSGDGVGDGALRTNFGKRKYILPTGQMGAESGGYAQANGGTAPTFTTNRCNYTISLTGEVSVQYVLDTDAGTDGSGAVQFKVSTPYVAATLATTTSWYSLGYYRAAAGTVTTCLCRLTSADTGVVFNVMSSIAEIQNGTFTNGDRYVNFSMIYQAF